MSLTLTIALRFLFRSTKSRQVTLFTLISVFGIAASVFLFLLINTLVTGLSGHLKKTLLGFEAPLFLKVLPDEFEQTQKNIREFVQTEKAENLKSIYTRQFDGLVRVGVQPSTGVKVRSVSNDFFLLKENDIEIFWLEGYDKDLFTGRDDVILLGEHLYQRLRFLPGDEEEVVVTHPFADIGPSGEVEPVERTLKVAGLFSTGHIDFDDIYALVPDQVLDAMASDLLLNNQFFLFPTRVDDTASIKTRWNKQFGTDKTKMETWFDRNQNILKAMELEKLMYFIIFIFVMLISCFNLAGVITIFGFAKSRESAIFRALGFSIRQIRSVFVTLGFILGTLGMSLGLLAGLALISFFRMTHFSLPSAYGFTELPLAVNTYTVVFLICVTPLIAAIVSWFPAVRFTRETVSEVLRLA